MILQRYAALAAMGAAILVGAPGRADFTFAHVTDIHVTADTSRYAELGLRGEDWVRSRAADSWEKQRRAIADAVNRAKPDFVVVTGDLSETGASIEFERVIEWARSITSPVYLILGNHDAIYAAPPAGQAGRWAEVGKRGLLNYERVFGSGYYSFRHQNAYFVILSSLSADPGFRPDGYQTKRLAEQDAWLAKELRHANAAGYPFLFVLQHHPTGPERPLAASLGEADASALLFGHIHRYTTPVLRGVQCISGTSVKGPANNKQVAPAFGLVHVDSDRASYQLFSPNGSPVFDPVTVRARETSPYGLWATRARLFPDLPAPTCDRLLSDPVPAKG